MEIEFIEESHTYLVDGMIVPSVTQIMKPLSDQYYGATSPEVLQNAARRGTEVHKAIYDLEQTGMAQEGNASPYVQNYLVAKKLKGFKPLMQEFQLTDGVFCGTLDMLAELNGQQVIIDLKCTSQLNKELAEVQLAGYQELCEKNGIGVDATYILHLKRDTYKLYKIYPNIQKWTELKKEYISHK